MSKKKKNCHVYLILQQGLGFSVKMLNATFNNISVILWWSVLLVEVRRVFVEKPLTCRKSLTNFIT